MAELGISSPAFGHSANVQATASRVAREESAQRRRDASSTQEGGAGNPEISASAQASPRARLGYSFEESDTFVEILDPRTGDVIQRFPPERAEHEIRQFANGDSGVILNRTA